MSEPTIEAIAQWWNDICDYFSTQVDLMYQQAVPLIRAMEDHGILDPTYDDDILEPEWDVFQ